MRHYDLLIVGAGVVGTSLGYALRDSGLTIGLLEASALNPDSPPTDRRNLGLALGSVQWLQRLGIWPQLATLATPIHCVHVSEAGQFGQTRFTAEALQLPALGFVVSYSTLAQTLQTAVTTLPTLTFLRPATLTQLQPQADGIQVTYREGDIEQQCHTRLLVAADGGGSTLRQLAHIHEQITDYQQNAIVANLSTEWPHHHTAYERFTADGSLALLPLPDQRCNLVWVMPQATADSALKWPESLFLERLQQQFGYRLGTLSRLGQRQSFPLQQIRPTALTKPRMVLLGNAAHTLHPIAAQGLNLGLRDVAVLANLLQSQTRNSDPGDPELLKAYCQQRQPDQQRTMRLTHGLVRLFGSSSPPIKRARRSGLLLLDHLPWGKNALAHQMMGLLP